MKSKKNLFCTKLNISEIWLVQSNQAIEQHKNNTFLNETIAQQVELLQ